MPCFPSGAEDGSDDSAATEEVSVLEGGAVFRANPMGQKTGFYAGEVRCAALCAAPFSPSPHA